MFASFYNPESKLADSKGGCYPLLAMAPLLNESSFTDEHIAYMKEMLSFYGKTMKDVAYFVADNCETNQSISRKLQIPLIGCAAHKLNLAVKLIFVHFRSLLEKVKSAITELGNLKNRGFLRSINALAPVTWNDTRWTSLFHALNRYVKLHPILTEEEGTPDGIKSKLLLPEEFQALVGLLEEFNFLYSATEYLQGENCHMAHVRSLFNEIIVRFGFIDGVEDKLAANGDLVVDPVFESAIVKVLRGNQGSLDRNELKKLKPFEKRGNLSNPRGQKRVNEAEEFHKSMKSRNLFL